MKKWSKWAKFSIGFEVSMIDSLIVIVLIATIGKNATWYSSIVLVEILCLLGYITGCVIEKYCRDITKDGE